MNAREEKDFLMETLEAAPKPPSFDEVYYPGASEEWAKVEGDYTTPAHCVRVVRLKD